MELKHALKQFKSFFASFMRILILYFLAFGVDENVSFRSVSRDNVIGENQVQRLQRIRSNHFKLRILASKLFESFRYLERKFLSIVAIFHDVDDFRNH